MRGPRGYWNEDSLILTEWEDPDYRIVVPQSLQGAVGLETPVLRWVAHKRLEVFAKHPEVRELDFSDGVFWKNWILAGPEPTRRKATNVFWEHAGTLFFAAISQHYGALTFSTVFRPRQSWLNIRLAAGKDNWMKRTEG
jgi:hypothetical protein